MTNNMKISTYEIVLPLIGEDEKKDEMTLSLAGPVSRLTEAERETIMATTSRKEMFDVIKEAGFFFSASK